MCAAYCFRAILSKELLLVALLATVAHLQSQRRQSLAADQSLRPCLVMLRIRHRAMAPAARRWRSQQAYLPRRQAEGIMASVMNRARARKLTALMSV